MLAQLHMYLVERGEPGGFKLHHVVGQSKIYCIQIVLEASMKKLKHAQIIYPTRFGIFFYNYLRNFTQYARRL